MFKNREEAGQRLAVALETYRDESPVILALPRGGVPVGYEIARALGAPLDIVLVRKIGAPMSPELAAGAVVDMGEGVAPELVLNEDVMRLYNVNERYIEDRKRQQLQETARRRALYNQDRAVPALENKTVIVVDDGIATGATMRAALQAVRRKNPAKLVLAVPVAPADTLATIESLVDEIVCLETPTPFYAVGQAYALFNQTSDEDVVALLKKTKSA